MDEKERKRRTESLRKTVEKNLALGIAQSYERKLAEAAYYAENAHKKAQDLEMLPDSSKAVSKELYGRLQLIEETLQDALKAYGTRGPDLKRVHESLKAKGTFQKISDTAALLYKISNSAYQNNLKDPKSSEGVRQQYKMMADELHTIVEFCGRAIEGTVIPYQGAHDHKARV